MKFGLLIPTRGRPNKLDRLLKSIENTISNKRDIEIALRIDDDDKETLRYIDKLNRDKFSFTINTYIDKRNKHMGKMWTNLWKRTNADVYQGLNDDVIFRTKNWDDIFAKEIKKYDDRVVFLWGDNGASGFPDHFFITDEVTDVLGYFCWGESPAFFNDTWIYSIFQFLKNELGQDRMIYRDDILIEHMRPGWTDTEPDQTFRDHRKEIEKWDPKEKFEMEKNINKRKNDAKKLAKRINNKLSPKIVFINLNVGSGIEAFGNRVKSLISDKFNFIEYKKQNPPSYVLQFLEKESPDIIILNEYYERYMEAISYYMIFNDSKFILLNHSGDTLISSLESDNYDDRQIAVRELSKDDRTRIINLNYWHPNNTWPDMIKGRVTLGYFPLPTKYEKKRKWGERSRDFLYFGRILPDRLNKEFIDHIEKTDLKVDIIGSCDEENYPEFTKRIVNSPNINYKGYVDEDTLVDHLNNYKFVICAPSVKQVFNQSLQQAMGCGVIPLVTTNYEGTYWLGWTKSNHLSFSTFNDLIKFMKYYKETSKNYEKFSNKVSNEMREEYSPNKFKEILINEITELMD